MLGGSGRASGSDEVTDDAGAPGRGPHGSEGTPEGSTGGESAAGDRGQDGGTDDDRGADDELGTDDELHADDRGTDDELHADDPGTDVQPGPDDEPASDRPLGSRLWRRLRSVRHLVAWAIVVPPALWLVVRATGLGAGTVVETAIVFTPYVALASVVALAAVALLRVWPATAAAGACCAGFALVMAPLFVSDDHPSPAPAGPTLRVMTSNVQFGLADAATVMALVEEREVDVLGVQELTPAFHRRLVAAGIDDLLPHTVVDARGGASGTGLYSRYPVERVDHHVMGRHENPTGRIEVPGAPPVQVTVVHPVPPVVAMGLGDWQRTLASLPRPDDDSTAHVLIGDFNATVDQPSMRDLLDDGYVDAAGAVGRGWVPTWRGSVLGAGLTIDHVLIDRSVGVDRVSVHGLPGSDHRNVLAELRLPAA